MSLICHMNLELDDKAFLHHLSRHLPAHSMWGGYFSERFPRCLNEQQFILVRLCAALVCCHHAFSRYNMYDSIHPQLSHRLPPWNTRLFSHHMHDADFSSANPHGYDPATILFSVHPISIPYLYARRNFGVAFVCCSSLIVYWSVYNQQMWNDREGNLARNG